MSVSVYQLELYIKHYLEFSLWGPKFCEPCRIVMTLKKSATYALYTYVVGLFGASDMAFSSFSVALSNCCWS